MSLNKHTTIRKRESPTLKHLTIEDRLDIYALIQSYLLLTDIEDTTREDENKTSISYLN